MIRSGMVQFANMQPLTNSRLQKESEKLGIKFIEREGDIYITDIVEAGVFAGTELKAGMRLLSVNKQSLQGCSLEETANILQNAGEKLVVVAMDPGYLTCTVTKESTDSKIGIVVKTIDGKVYIASINPSSLFANTELEVGHRIIRYVYYDILHETPMWVTVSNKCVLNFVKFVKSQQ